MEQHADPKDFAQRRFAAPDECVRLIEMGERFATDAPDVVRTLLDVVVTCWTLYVMRDVDGTLVEIRRCLRPGGRLVAAADAAEHMCGYHALAAAALRSALGRPPYPDVTARFDLDSGVAKMRRHFASVEVRRWRGWPVLPDVGSLLQIWDAWRPDTLVGPDAAVVRAEFERRAREWLARDGQIRISRHWGAIVGTSAA